MKPASYIEQEIEQVLSSFDGAERATANPFLYTRIQERLQRKPGAWQKLSLLMNRPSFIVATLILVLLMNAIAFIPNNSPASVIGISSIQQDEDQVFAKEYFSEPASEGFLVASNDIP